MLKFLGVDPGLASTGWGLIEIQSGKAHHVEHGVIKTKSMDKTGHRLKYIYDELSKVIKLYSPQIASIESLYFAKNVKSAMPVSEAKGVILLCFESNNLITHEYTPLQIKQALVGNGRAEKEQVQMMVKLILGLKEVIKPDHASDALAAAICAFHSNPIGV
ncbi:crossover junction endodeoxyribonuclease RuvC [Spirochaeta cellobiosiphila]|uniref:crossover junction endodeoxyribonuclease RuvC n=1 Tax=Spirochaeta cellobiosiphila TaxID=504483 RepID=UPI0003F7F59F|nr:crossover junction endodeoxyribonuclease RuvC [Spirochaeta cellobiosiphila]